jgi:hypothetical protein
MLPSVKTTRQYGGLESLKISSTRATTEVPSGLRYKAKEPTVNVDGGTVDDGPWAEVAAAAAEIEPLEGKGPSQKPSAASRTLQTLQKWR